MILSSVKNRIVTPGARPLDVRGGAFKGLRLQLDLQHQSQVYLGLYERELHGWLRTLGASVRTAFDVGAADGAYTIYFLKRTPARRVFAFEPDADARKSFTTNLRLNGIPDNDRLRLLPRPVGARHGDLALDGFFDDVEVPALVKVDVEGAELDVLHGAERLRRRGGLSWIIETHAPEIERECAALLRADGLAVTIVSPAWWRIAIPEHRPIAHNRWLIACAKGHAANPPRPA